MKHYFKTALITAVIFLALLPITGFADEVNSISVSGHFRLRQEGNAKTYFTSNRDYGVLRVRPILNFKRDSRECKKFCVTSSTRLPMGG